MPNDTIEVFISYSKQDKELRDGLLAHLRPLEREGIITWSDRQILPGTEWDDEIRIRLNAADIILLLISADFLNTDYCTQVEIPEALRRHEADEAIVMPVILRYCSWKFTPLADIQAYPEKAKPIKSWTDIDEAYTNVVEGVYLAATEIKKRRNQRQEAERHRLQQERQCQAEEQERQRQVEEQEREAEAAERQRQEEEKELVSEKGVDYKRLRDLLKAGQWKAADKETADRMCEVMGRQEEGWLRLEDIQNFPCADLHTIDQLWVKHSQGKFGFSVQKEIYVQCGAKLDSTYPGEEIWRKFCDLVGWRVNGLYIAYENLKFDPSICLPGELPSKWEFLGGLRGIVRGGGRYSSSVLQRLVKCNIRQS
jgi:hypothetical protein